MYDVIPVVDVASVEEDCGAAAVACKFGVPELVVVLDVPELPAPGDAGTAVGWVVGSHTVVGWVAGADVG